MVDPQMNPEAARTVASLGHSAHEVDGAFYVLTSDAWHERRGDRVLLWRSDEASPVLELTLSAGSDPFTVLLLVCSAASRDVLEASLRDGTEWPVVLGPRGSSSSA